MFKKKFFYGDGTDHVVDLTQNQADAVNKMLVTEVIEGEGQETLVRINLDEQELKHYNSAVDILNKYCAAHTVYYENTEEPILRPKK